MAFKIRIVPILLAFLVTILWPPSVFPEGEGEVIQVKVRDFPKPEVGFQIYPGVWVPFDDELTRVYQIFPAVGLTGIFDLSPRSSLALTLGYAYGEGNFVPGSSEEASRTFLNHFWLGQEIRFVRRVAGRCRYYWGTGLRVSYMSERFKERVEGEVKGVSHTGWGSGWGLGFGADFLIKKSYSLGVRTDLFLLGSNDLSWEGINYHLGNTGLWFGLTTGFYH